MISLIIPPRDQIPRIAKMLADEFGTASNIKSRVNRLSVLGAITSVQQRLKLYSKGNLPLEFLDIFDISVASSPCSEEDPYACTQLFMPLDWLSSSCATVYFSSSERAGDILWNHSHRRG